jgi:nucleoid-associated protein YgaU
MNREGCSMIVRSTWIAVMLLLVATGCAKKTPQQVIDVNRALSQAKDDCASVYASDSLSSVQGRVDEMNAYVDDKKMKKAKKSAQPLLADVEALDQQAQQNRERAKSDAEAALKSAEAAVEQARQAEAATYNAAGFRQAESKLAEAAGAMKDPCQYLTAKRLADDAARQAANAREAALAEKRRLEEERLAEEERRRKEEEARRLEEERRRQAKPGTYVVKKGDYLWRISGMQQIYQNPIYWPIIHQANKNEISDPDLIYPNQEFTIPRDMSDQQMLDRLYRLWAQY